MVQIGETHSNELQARFLEHRQVTGVAGCWVSYRVVLGARTPALDRCKLKSFVDWARRKVEA